MTHPLGVALAAVAAAIPTTLVYDGMPPPRLHGDATMTVAFVAQLDAPGPCGKPPEGKTFAGCVRNGVVYMPNPCPLGDREWFARIMCHEKAHRLGWPADHGA